MHNALILMTIFLVLLLPCWQRLAGAGGMPYLGRAPEALAAFSCTLPMYLLHLHAGLWATQTVLLYFAIELGHGVALGMGAMNPQAAGRRQSISWLVDLVNKLPRYEYQSRAWCSLYFGVKGFLIGLCMLPMGIVLAALWPVCYRTKQTWMHLHGTELAEYLTGYALMLSILLNMLLYWAFY